MAPLGKFTSQSMANQKPFLAVVHRVPHQHHGSKRGKCMSFVSTRELSTPLCSPRLKSWVRNKARLLDLRPLKCERRPHFTSLIVYWNLCGERSMSQPTAHIPFVCYPHCLL